MENDAEDIECFLTETYEHLDRMDNDLLSLEKNPTLKDAIKSVFRAIHTIKGTGGVMGYSKLESVAHVGESLLSKVRDGKINFNNEIANALLSVGDAIRQILSNIEKNGTEGDGDYSNIISTLSVLENVQIPQAGDASNVRKTISSMQEGRAPAEGNASPVPPSYKMEFPATSALSGTEPKEASTDLLISAMSDGSIRVDVGLLDKLMTLAGELVLARNQILQCVATSIENNNFNAASQRLNLVTSELQEGVMKTRMQPIGNIWNKFPRVIRDLSKTLGKKVILEMEGNDTELDRTIIEAIKDPLTHLVRNAVSHGIESPDKRLRIGKPQEGRLCLRAFHEGGHVNIEFADDGGGIDPALVRHKALFKGLLSEEDSMRMTDRETIDLIFLPGFSTADEVTNVSGRGVGMDVVKANIEKIGGIVDVHTLVGHGTTFKMKIPLTLAIIPAIIVTSNDEHYAIPQVSLLELVFLEGEQAKKGIEFVNDVPVYRLREKLLPLVYLDQIIASSEEATCTKTKDKSLVFIVVLQADDKQFGLVVDEINDTEEIVVKPIDKQLKHIDIFAGATIMGNGSVVLILDILGVAQRANVVEETRQRALAEMQTQLEKTVRDKHSLLLVKTSGDGRLAIPLSMITRLEEFPKDIIEQAGGHDVVQYRDGILPLYYLSSYLPERRSSSRLSESEEEADELDNHIHVVVHEDGHESVGLVVEQILDIVEEDIQTKQKSSRENILYTVVIQNRITEILDLEAILKVAV